MSADPARTATAKRLRSWSSPSRRHAPMVPVSELRREPLGSTSASASTVHAPAPFLDLLHDVSTIDLLRWLPASLTTRCAENAVDDVPLTSAAPHHISRCGTKSTFLDVFFSTHLSTCIGNRAPDAMLSQIQRQLTEAMGAAAPVDACVLRLLLDRIFRAPRVCASPQPLRRAHACDEDENANRPGAKVNTIEKYAVPTRDCEGPPDRVPPRASVSPRVPAAEAASAHEHIDASVRKDTVPLKSILKATSTHAVPAPLPSAPVETADQPTSAVDTDLSLAAKLLYVVLQTSTVGATRWQSTEMRAAACDAGDLSSTVGNKRGDTEKQAPQWGATSWTPAIVTKVGDPSSPAWWNATPTPASCAAGLTPSHSSLQTAARRSPSVTSAAQTQAQLMVRSHPESRLWLAPSTVALVESSPDVATELRWSTALDPVVHATLHRGASGRGVRVGPSDRLAGSSWDPRPVPRLEEPLFVFPQAHEDDAVRQLFATKAHSTSGNRSPLTNREPRLRGGDGFARPREFETAPAAGESSPSTASAHGAALTAPPPLGISAPTDDATAAHTHTQESRITSLLTPQYTESECGMLFLALHYCCVGVADPFLLTWLVRGSGEKTNEEEEEEEGDRVHTVGGSDGRRRQAGLKRLYAAQENAPRPHVNAKSPMMALHPRFCTMQEDAEEPLSWLNGQACVEGVGPKRAKSESVSARSRSASRSRASAAAAAPPPGLCRRNVACLLVACCDAGTLFVRLQQLCEVAEQPVHRAGLGSYGRCAVDGLRAVLRIAQRQASAMMTVTRSPPERRQSLRVENALHGLTFDRVLDAFYRLERVLMEPLRVLAAVFLVDTTARWDVNEALTQLSSAELLSKLYAHTTTTTTAAHLRPWHTAPHRSHGSSEDDDDDDEEAEHDTSEAWLGQQALTRAHTARPPRLTDAVGYLFCCTLSPLHRFLHHWMTRGDRRDPFDEFFIVPSYGATASGYDVDPSPQRLPNFIHEETAHLWLQVGLSMRVLRLAASHVVYSAGFVFRRLLREEEAVDGLHGVEEYAAAREDAGLLHEAVGQFLSAVTGEVVPSVYRSQPLHGDTQASSSSGIPALNPLAAHAAVAHWRLFFAGCDDVLMSAIERGLGAGESEDEDEEVKGDGRDTESRTGSDSRTIPATSVPSSLHVDGGQSTTVVALTQASLRRNQHEHQRQGEQSLEEQASLVGNSLDTRRVIVKKRPTRREEGRPRVVTSSPPGSHITIPLYSEMSAPAGAGAAAHTKARSSSVSMASRESGTSRLGRGRARSFMSYDSGVSTSSTALSSGATSALYGAIKAEHRLRTAVERGVTGEETSERMALAGSGGGGGLADGFGATRRQLQEAYEATLRAHKRTARLAEWKAQRQSLWVSRAKAVRDAVSIVRATYASHEAHTTTAAAPTGSANHTLEDMSRNEAEGGSGASLSCVSGLVRPCTHAPPRRSVVALYPHRTRPSATATAAVAFRDTAPAFSEAKRDLISQHASSAAAANEAGEREEVEEAVATPPRPAAIEITISPVATPIVSQSVEGARSKADSEECGVSQPQQPHASDLGACTPPRSSPLPGRARQTSSQESWRSPQLVATDGRAPLLGSSGYRRAMAADGPVGTALEALWSGADEETEITEPTPPQEVSTLCTRYDSTGLPQPDAYFVVADINDDSDLEQRTRDSAPPASRRRGRMDRVTRAREAMAVWRREAEAAQEQAAAIVDLPAYHEACQEVVSQWCLAADADATDTAHIRANPQVRQANAAEEVADRKGEGVERASEDSKSKRHASTTAPITAMRALLEGMALSESYHRTWWRDAPQNGVNADRDVWQHPQSRTSTHVHHQTRREQDDYFLNPLVHNTTQQLIDDPAIERLVQAAPHTTASDAQHEQNEEADVEYVGGHAVQTRGSRPVPPWAVATAEKAAQGAHLVLRLSSAQRRLLVQCPQYYHHIALIATRYSTHKALQLSLLPIYGLQRQWLCACLDVCLLQHAPTASAMTDWWVRHARAQLEHTGPPSQGQPHHQPATAANNVWRTQLLDGLNSFFRESWERLSAVAGAATSSVRLPTKPTRVHWRLVPTPVTTTPVHAAEPRDAETSFLRSDTVAPAVDALLHFLSDLRLCVDAPMEDANAPSEQHRKRTGDDDDVMAADAVAEGSMLTPDATLLADYGDLFSTLLFWKLIDQVLYQLYQDGLQSQEKAVFFFCRTARALLHTVQSLFWERLQALATHYRHHSVESFGAETLYGYTSVEAFQRQHHGFVAECRFTAMLSGSFQLCRARLLAVLQVVVAAQVNLSRATARVLEAATVAGTKEQRRRVRDLISQHLHQLVDAAVAFAEEMRVVQNMCAERVLQNARPSRHASDVTDAEAAVQLGDEEDDDDNISFRGDGWYNATDTATVEGHTPRDRQQAWRARAQYLTHLVDSVRDVVNAAADKW